MAPMKQFIMLLACTRLRCFLVSGLSRNTSNKPPFEMATIRPNMRVVMTATLLVLPLPDVVEVVVEIVVEFTDMRAISSGEMLSYMAQGVYGIIKQLQTTKSALSVGPSRYQVLQDPGLSAGIKEIIRKNV